MNNEDLKKEVESLKKELKELKENLRTIIIAQQNNSRDPFRTDRGEVILKKNANIKSRKSIVPEYDSVLSTYFNEQARQGVNVMYIGHDGGNGQRNTGEMASLVIHDTNRPFDIGDLFRNGSIYHAITERDTNDIRPDTVFIAVKTKYLIGDPTDNSNSSFITANDSGLAGLGYWKDGNLNVSMYVRDGDVYLSPAPGKNIKVGGVNGFTGTVPTPTSITVKNGIVTAVS